MKNLYDDIIAVYPELTRTMQHDEFLNGSIELGDDGDGIQYIRRWEYYKPLPEGMKVGKN